MADVKTVSDQASTGEMSLTTYYYYIKAWNIAYNKRYDSEGAFIDEIRKLASISKQPQIYKENFDKGSYIRGILTLRLMNDLPVDKHPKLTFTANIWLPVHSYYAIEGAGLALLSIRLQNPPQKTHVGFSSSFTNPVLSNLFPYPFNGLCEGGPKPADFLFRNLDTSAAEVKAQSNIACPSENDVDNCIGKSLSTTRKKKLDKRFKEQRGKEVRPGYTRRNLSEKDKARICNKECGTSICDLIYRMRERSNYDNPFMYLSGTHDVDSARSHYKDLLHLTKALIEGINTLIEIYLGKRELDTIKSELKPFEMPVINDIPFPLS
jgi:hypothetical protein